MFKIRNDIERLNELVKINQKQANMLNIYFMTDEIFTGIRSQYKKVNNKYALFRTKIDGKELGITTQQSDEQLDTTDMPDSEICCREKKSTGKRLKNTNTKSNA